jgi:hypothetical protein
MAGIDRDSLGTWAQGINLEDLHVDKVKPFSLAILLQFSVIAFKSLILNGGQRRDRTADAGLFRAALYH